MGEGKASLLVAEDVYGGYGGVGEATINNLAELVNLLPVGAMSLHPILIE